MTRNIIIKAPSKFDLCIAFFDRPNPEMLGGRRSVLFTIRVPERALGLLLIEVVINSISWEDGSGESWCFEGYCKTDVGQPRDSHAGVKGWFRTSDRKGWIDIDAPVQSSAARTVRVDPDFRRVIDQIATERNLE